MKISVVIPSYNDKSDLERCLESLGDQSVSEMEIIVVDDGSADGTVEMLERLSASVPGISFYKQSHKGAGSARNLGAKKAGGDVLVFVDSDMVFDRDFLAKLVLPIRGGVKGTFSKEEFVSNWENIWARCWNINEGWQDKRRHPRNYPDTQPVFRAILKSEFDKVGGYTPGGYDDDWSLSAKLGYMSVNAPGAVFYHRNPSTLGEIFRHANWVSKRKYKYGYFGLLVAIIRVFLPVSIIVGILKSINFGVPQFIVFKVVYDLGIFFGLIEFLITGRGAK